jgi:hypothetical protein
MNVILYKLFSKYYIFLLIIVFTKFFIQYMKNKLNLIAIILFSSFILLSGCKKVDDKPPGGEDQQRARLSKTWMPETPVTYDGGADSRFASFEVTFNSNGTYTAQNGYPVFRNSGNWAFKPDTNFSTLILDGGPEFVITSLTDTKLAGTVDLQGGANARTTGVDGVYVFNLVVKP